MQQQLLFPIASKNTDPDTSRIAEERITVTGIRGKQSRQVYDLVVKHPGSTSRELAAFSSGELDRWQVARRLPDLQTSGMVRKGPVRKCKIDGTKAVTWWEFKAENDEDDDLPI